MPELQNSFVKKIAVKSIEGQEASWKNELTRRFIEFDREEALINITNREKEGFWYNGKGRKIVNGAVFFAGYMAIGEHMQHMDKKQYFQIADSVKEIFDTVGLEPDRDFFRWQMSDFFGAAFLTWVASGGVKFVFRKIGARGILGKDREWWENKSNMASAFGVGVLLIALEAAQMAEKNQPLDVKDLAAYMAGLGMYLGSEKMWQEYQLFKEKYGFKLKPFVEARKAMIADQYLKIVSGTTEFMLKSDE